MKTLSNILLAVTVVLAMFGAKSLYDTHKTPELPTNIEEWTTEQLEDQQFDYIDAIEVIKDEQRRRARLADRKY